ncbi:hypothetical protein [Gordonia aichiensis]|uniref:hypothetical protein n=1 Tax=Gordonia aichiensis TaxID=36820 RepID=UPI0003474064|nr:hypothetical protein [Gordonia aichiensis]
MHLLATDPEVTQAAMTALARMKRPEDIEVLGHGSTIRATSSSVTPNAQSRNSRKLRRLGDPAQSVREAGRGWSRRGYYRPSCWKM